MARLLTLKDAVQELVHDGDTLAMEGFTHLIPYAAAHEIIRQGLRDLTLVRLTPDIIYDQLIGMGCVRKLVFSWGGNPGVGSLHRFRDAVEKDWPSPLEIEEHSHAGLANRYVAGASGLPFMILRGYAGTDISRMSSNITSTDGSFRSVATIECPFTGQPVSAVQAIRPDVTIIHAQQADHNGNVQLWGITGVQKEAVLAATHSLVTVEEIVSEIRLKPGGMILPSWVITAVSCVPGGAHPSYATGYYERDNSFYVEWESISRDRTLFKSWMAENVLSGAVG